MTWGRDEDTGLTVVDSGRLAAHIAPSPLESDPEQALSLDHYVRLLRRHLWKIALTVILCTSITYYLCTRITPVKQQHAGHEP